ncbi:MAG TPA: hypothetical protein VJU77_13775 [Chthoniobacterales bacterium]|nr:hypothetical protein [Chthoniobacterales bacterium]
MADKMQGKGPDPTDSPVDWRLSNGAPLNASPDDRVESIASGSSWLKRFVPRSESRFVFLFAMYCYAVALGGIASQLIALGGLWEIRVDPQNDVAHYVRPGFDGRPLLEVLLLAPVIESLIMIGIIELVRRFGFKVCIQVAASVGVSCLMHGRLYWFSAIAVAPGLFIIAATYAYCRHISFWTGLWMIILLHFALNFLPGLSLIIERVLS